MNEYQLFTLGQICSLIKDGTHGTHPRQKDGIPLISAKDVQGGRITISSDTSRISREEYETIHRSYEIKEGDLLISLVGSIGRCALVTRNHGTFSAQRSVGILRSDSSKVDPKYLYHATCDDQFQKQLLSRSKSTAQAGVYLGELAQCSISLPPLPEQKKIAEILSGIDRAINARRNSAEAIAQIVNFTAEDLFQRTSVAYNSVKIGDCTCRLWQGINTAADKVEYHDRGVPILQAKHVTSGRIDSQGARHLSEEDYDKYSERYQPQTGDILFTNIGTIGKSALVTHRSRFLIAWNIFLISPSEEIIGEYLQHFLQSLDRRNYFHEHAAGNATKFINKTLISELEVPLPPKEQQIKICNQIRAISKAEENDRNTIAKYLELKRSLLIDLLSGRKRVSDARVIDGVGI